MAAAHAGYITINCDVCANNESMRFVKGCDAVLEAPTDEIPLNETLFEYYNCPAHFIPDSLNVFLTIYQFGLDFGGLLINDMTNKFVEASRFYKSRFNHFQRVSNG